MLSERKNKKGGTFRFRPFIQRCEEDYLAAGTGMKPANGFAMLP